MAYTGHVEVQMITKTMILVTAAGFDADAEKLSDVAAFDLEDHSLPFTPTHWTFVSSRTAGATDTVAVDFKGSVLGIEWTDVCPQITDTEGTVTTNPVESAPSFGPTVDGSTAAATKLPYRYFDFVVTTVGAGNTLTLYALGCA